MTSTLLRSLFLSLFYPLFFSQPLFSVSFSCFFLLLPFFLTDLFFLYISPPYRVCWTSSAQYYILARSPSSIKVSIFTPLVLYNSHTCGSISQKIVCCTLLIRSLPIMIFFFFFFLLLFFPLLSVFCPSQHVDFIVVP